MKRFTSLLLIFGLFLIASPLSAVSFSEKCPDISSCAKAVGEMLGQKYVFDLSVKGQIEATPNLDLTQENAELLFTNMLNLNGYSRVPSGQANTFLILRQRDARDQPVPVVSASQTEAPKLPNNWDIHTLKYKATHPLSVENIARTSRTFMPAASRIVPEGVTGTLLVTDTAINLNKLYGIIRDLDQEPSEEYKRMQAEQRAKPTPRSKAASN